MKTHQSTLSMLVLLVAQGSALANREVYQDVSSSTVMVTVGNSQGSGVLVDAERRLVVTALARG